MKNYCGACGKPLPEGEFKCPECFIPDLTPERED